MNAAPYIAPEPDLGHQPLRSSEARVVATLLQEPAAHVERARERIESTDFVDPVLGQVFRQIIALTDAGGPEAVTLDGVARELNHLGEATRTNLIRLAELVDDPTTSHTFTADLAEVRRAGLERRAAAIVARTANGRADANPVRLPDDDFEELVRLRDEYAGARADGRNRGRFKAFFADSSIDAWWDEVGELRIPSPRDWVIEGLAERGTQGVILGAGGTGKGHLSVCLGVHLALGRDIGQFRVRRPTGTLIVSREDDDEEHHRRGVAELHALTEALPADDCDRLCQHLHIVDLTEHRAPLDDPDFYGAVIERASQIPNLGLVWLDPLFRFSSLTDETGNYGEAARVVNDITTLIAKQADCFCVVSHHVPKEAIRGGRIAGDPLGSILLREGPRIVMTLRRLERDDDLRRRYGLDQTGLIDWLALEISKANYAPTGGHPLLLRRADGGALVPVDARECEVPEAAPSAPDPDEMVEDVATLDDAGQPTRRPLVAPGEQVSLLTVARRLAGSEGRRDGAGKLIKPGPSHRSRAELAIRSWIAGGLGTESGERGFYRFDAPEGD